MYKILILLIAALVPAPANASEIENAVKDRPQLLDVISPGDDIWKWLDQHFKNTNGLPARWSDESPNLPSQYLAAHTFDSNGAAIIMVVGKRPDGSPIGGEEVLSMLVFELMNASHRDAFKNLDEAAKQHKINKETYIEEMARIEYISASDLNRFRVDLWIPNAVKKGIPWNHDLWKKGSNEDFELYLRVVREMKAGYPDDVFGPRYEALLRAASSPTDNARLYFNVGNAMKAMGDLDGAILKYTKAIELNPGYFHAYCNRGNAREAKGDLTGALLDYDKAIILSPHNSRYYCNRAYAELLQKDIKGALADYGRAIKMNPKNSNAYAARGFAKHENHDLNGAIDDYGQAIQLNSANQDAYTNRGHLEYEKHDFKAALLDFKRSIQLDPADASAYLNLSYIDEHSGRWSAAISDLREYCSIYPLDSDYTYLRIWLLRIREQQGDEANRELSAYLKTRSSDTDWVSKIGGLLLGRVTEAEFLTYATSPDESKDAQKQCEAWYYAGMKRLLSGDKVTALTYLKECVATQQKDEVEYQLAENELTTMSSKTAQ